MFDDAVGAIAAVDISRRGDGRNAARDHERGN